MSSFRCGRKSSLRTDESTYAVSETRRGKRKFADYILYWKPNIPLAVVEAKDNNHTVGHGMQQALDYAEILQIPFAFSSNGDGFVMHDRTGESEVVETDLGLSEFPSPDDLWRRYCKANGLDDWKADLVAQDYYDEGSGRQPRYYQINAVNRTIEAIARGQERILLVMATGTGKTYTAFQIIWRLWKADHKKRILFLADRKHPCRPNEDKRLQTVRFSDDEDQRPKSG